MVDQYDDIVFMVREFACGEIAEYVADDDRYPDAPFRTGLYEKCEEVGFLSLLLGEDAGGSGESPAALAEVLYELSRVDASAAAGVLCQAFAHSILLKAGKPGLATEAGLIASTIYDDPLEPPVSVTAEEHEADWRLSGSFEFVALAPAAGSFLLPVLTDGETALFFVHGGAGVNPGEPLLTLGLRACPVSDLELESARATLIARGEEAREAYLGAVREMRGPAAAISAGIIAGSLEEGLEYCKGRYQGYKQIIDHQQMRAELGRITAEAEASRELFRSACRGNGSSTGMLGMAVQLVAGEMAARATNGGVQVLGGYGYTQDYGQEKRMRDAKQVQGLFGCKELILQDLTLAALG